MKKTIFVLTAIFSFVVLFTACKETKKEEVKEDVKIESHEGHDHGSEEMSTADVYQCPMDCEKGKTYDEVGSCPVCKMDLKVKSVDAKEMIHADNCKCKEAGECTCEGDVCECQSEMASMTKDSEMCAPGKCSCKA
ncbi:heavy metal-binding domain-containing protein [uncultured Lutibacter sp.]|uniref:heavy metal-binding domain-containing protein n=1 Tax=uncultured Lutibacter sp. TaxID=437739 RepID=UPI002618A6D2|nr:heavy metal-binding domain-containing protein [uncultured Lutibacter sp.]